MVDESLSRHHRLVIYRDADRQWRWRRVATNGRIVATGGEGYHNEDDCARSARQVNARPFILVMTAVPQTADELSHPREIYIGPDEQVESGNVGA